MKWRVSSKRPVGKKRGKYNIYTPQQRAQIGNAKNGPANAAVHFNVSCLQVVIVRVASYT